MAHSRDEVRTDMTNGTEYLKGNGKEMIIADDFCVLIFVVFARRFSCASNIIQYHFIDLRRRNLLLVRLRDRRRLEKTVV